MQLRDLVLPSPCVLHLRVCLAAGLPFFHYPIPVRSLLWSSLGTPPCRPSTRTLERSAHCSQHLSQRGFQEQRSPPVTQYTGDSSAHPFTSFLTVKGPSLWPASLTVAVYTQAHLQPACGSRAACRPLHGRGPQEASVPAQAWLCPGVSSVNMDGLLSFTSGPLCAVPP